MWVIAIVGKEQWDSCGFINLVIYSKLSKGEPIYLVILGKAHEGA